MKVLIANRGEIAVRVARACRELGLTSVAVYSDCDRESMHVRSADEAYPIGAPPARESYLDIDKLLAVAARSGATLVHPGYGFLAENAGFSEACRDAGLTFVGPSPEAIRLMGSKTAAREAAIAAGVPVVPGTEQPFALDAPDAFILSEGDRIGFPLLVKAVAGGGGKGMRSVATREDLLAAVRTAGSEAASAFGDASVFLERLVVRPRHIEVQLMGDSFGTIVPFVERECSIQRRHQKVVEESPSTRVSDTTRRAMAECAAAVARSVGYTNAGTIEFLLDDKEHFYFLEMNTRLQVEHPVTEMVTGIDLVHWQLRVAMGERLTIDPARALTPRGHAIECRIIAEDPDQGFMPSPGRVLGLEIPQGPGVRDDGGVAEGFDIPIFYDSLIAKLVVWGESRDVAIGRLRRALAGYQVRGVKTTLPFFRWLTEQPEFARADFHTSWLDGVLADRRGEPFVSPTSADVRAAVIAAAIHASSGSAVTAGSDAIASNPSSGHWLRNARDEALRR
ncbi:MAG: acetyl-CoA carboxylase biotin carboxylase subunit [Acidobacteriota bacterium]|nr:acetyl-CoA carboxylase biotin carboxylase subunit [Acidobacteriota bacterium]